MGDFWRDVRYSFRQLGQRKIFSGVVVALIALGIGSNTLLFSLVDGLLLKSLPVSDPGNLFQLEKNHQRQVRPDTIFIVPEYQALQRTSGVFESMHAESPLGLRPLDLDGQTLMITVDSVSARFFSDLGVHPERGRVFAEIDEKTGSVPALLSYRFWRNQWATNQPILGRTIRIDGHPFTVVGVLPHQFHGLDLESQADVTLPLAAGPLILGQPLQSELLNLYVRLKPGTSFATAQGKVELIVKQAIEESFQGLKPTPAAATVRNFLDFKIGFLPLEHGTSRLRGLFSKALMLLMGGVVVLLCIACFNVGGLLLARSQSRRREMAIRMSVGASQWHILRQLSTESFLLGSLGAALGVCLAYGLSPALTRILPVLRDEGSQLALTPSIDLTPDWRILAFVAAATLISGLLFGVAPGLAALRVDLNAELKQLPGSKQSRLHLPAGSILVSLQVTLTVVLVCASGLMIRTYWNLLHADPGFDFDHILSFRIDPQAAGYKNQRLRQFYEQLEQNVRSLPGIRGAGFVVRELMRGKGFGATVVPTGRTLPPRTFLNSSLNLVSPGYFDAMGMRLIEGRGIRVDDAENPKRPYPVVVDQAFAQAFFPGQDVIGRTFAHGIDGRVEPDFRIIGLVSSAKYRSLRDIPPPTFYAVGTLPASGMLNLNVRTYAEPRSVIAEVRQTLRKIDSRVPIIEISTMREEVHNSLWQERLVLVMTAFFGIAGLLLASIGLYGALTQAVAQRTRDIGIRMALGARVRHIITAVSLPQFILIGVAVATGFAASAAVLTVTKSLLYGVSSSDPASYALAIGIILVTAILAAIAPISRAIKVDPATVLRAE